MTKMSMRDFFLIVLFIKNFQAKKTGRLGGVPWFFASGRVNWCNDHL